MHFINDYRSPRGTCRVRGCIRQTSSHPHGIAPLIPTSSSTALPAKSTISSIGQPPSRSAPARLIARTTPPAWTTPLPPACTYFFVWMEAPLPPLSIAQPPTALPPARLIARIRLAYPSLPPAFTSLRLHESTPPSFINGPAPNSSPLEQFIARTTPLPPLELGDRAKTVKVIEHPVQ